MRRGSILSNARGNREKGYFVCTPFTVHTTSAETHTETVPHTCMNPDLNSPRLFARYNNSQEIKRVLPEDSKTYTTNGYITNYNV